MISDEAVEAAKAAFAIGHDSHDAAIRAALEAAAPHMLAAVWNEGMWFGGVRGQLTSKKLHQLKASNPYRSQT